MLIAREKRKQNIIEYLLYMYQVEDTIRACKFDIEKLEQRVISQYRISKREMQTCLNALYAFLFLRIQKKRISEETLEGMQTFSNLLGMLAAWFKKQEETR